MVPQSDNKKRLGFRAEWLNLRNSAYWGDSHMFGVVPFNYAWGEAFLFHDPVFRDKRRLLKIFQDDLPRPFRGITTSLKHPGAGISGFLRMLLLPGLTVGERLSIYRHYLNPLNLVLFAAAFLEKFVYLLLKTGMENNGQPPSTGRYTTTAIAGGFFGIIRFGMEVLIKPFAIIRERKKIGIPSLVVAAGFFGIPFALMGVGVAQNSAFMQAFGAPMVNALTTAAANILTFFMPGLNVNTSGALMGSFLGIGAGTWGIGFLVIAAVWTVFAVAALITRSAQTVEHYNETGNELIAKKAGLTVKPPPVRRDAAAATAAQALANPIVAPTTAATADVDVEMAEMTPPRDDDDGAGISTSRPVSPVAEPHEAATENSHHRDTASQNSGSSVDPDDPIAQALAEQEADRGDPKTPRGDGGSRTRVVGREDPGSSSQSSPERSGNDSERSKPEGPKQ